MSEPLRILQVGSGFPNWGGAELHLVNLSEQLAARGHDVTVAARPGGFVEAEAKKRGLATLAATVRRQWDRHDYGVLHKFMRENKTDVCHVHWSTDYLVAPWASRRAGVPVSLMSRHSPYRLKSGVGRYLYKRVLFDRIIALSESVRQTLLSQGMPPEQIITIHHGTDIAAFRETTLPPDAVRAEWGLHDSPYLVAGIVGRIAPEKGILHFLEAAALANAQGVRVAAVVIGDGIQKDTVMASPFVAQIEKNGGKIVFAGFRSDVNNAVNALDCLVLASTWEEPCAAVVQQAMALGKPVIGTRIGGTPEMISAATGFLVPPADSAALADALIRLSALPPHERNRMGQHGVTRVEADFTLGGMTDKIEALYRNSLRLV